MARYIKKWKRHIIPLFGSIIVIYSLFFVSTRTPLTHTTTYVNDIENSCVIERLEQQLFAAKNEEQIISLLMQHMLFSREFLNIQYTDQGAYQEISKALFSMCKDPIALEIYEESKQQFDDLSHIKNDLLLAFSKLIRYYPNIKVPPIYTIITGMQQDLYVSKNLIVIGLDCFLGKNPKFSLHNIPKYSADTYNTDSIVCKIMLLYIQQFNAVNKNDKTLLAEMLYYGKNFFLIKDILPDLPEHVILGYTSDQLKDLNRYKTVVWEHFIENELFFNTNHVIKKQYIYPRPFTGEISSNCPGSIGKWLGWEIVKEYMKRNKKGGGTNI